VPASQLCHNPLATNNDYDRWVQWKTKELPYKYDITIPRYRECFHHVSGHLSSHERLSRGMPSSAGNIKSPFLPFSSTWFISYKCREMPISSFWAGLMLLKHVTHGLFSKFWVLQCEVTNASICKKKTEHFDEMWGSHSGDFDDYHLLGCDDVWFGR